MSFGEILTCVREDIPVTAVVFNNEQWGAEKKNQVDFYDNRFDGVNLKNPSWAELARTMGAEGVEVKNLGDVGEALREGCAMRRRRARPRSSTCMSRWNWAIPSAAMRSRSPSACSTSTSTPTWRKTRPHVAADLSPK